MKRKEIGSILTEYIRRLRRITKLVSPGCDIEIIHELRVQFKKLRAFIRLLRRQHRIPWQLKKIYRMAGELRDRQLLYENIRRCPPDRLTYANYLDDLFNEIATRQQDLREAIDYFSFSDFNSVTRRHLPRKLTKGAVKAYFFHQKFKYERLLREAGSDDSIHAVRKCAKDLLYNAAMLNRYKAAKRILKDQEEFKTLDDAIGEYNNLRIGLSLLAENLPRAARRSI